MGLGFETRLLDSLWFAGVCWFVGLSVVIVIQHSGGFRTLLGSC